MDFLKILGIFILASVAVGFIILGVTNHQSSEDVICGKFDINETEFVEDEDGGYYLINTGFDEVRVDPSFIHNDCGISFNISNQTN